MFLNHHWWSGISLVLKPGNGHTFIKGEYGAVETKGGKILQFLDTEGESCGHWKILLRIYA